jgi:hypothetical protein
MTRILLHGANRCPTAISTSPPRTQLTASSPNERGDVFPDYFARSSATCQMQLRPHPARFPRADRLRIFDPGCRSRVNATLRRRANHAFPKPDNRDQCFPQRPKTRSRHAALSGPQVSSKPDELLRGSSASASVKRLRHSSSNNELWLLRFCVLLKWPLAFKFHPHERLVDNPIHRKIV